MNVVPSAGAASRLPEDGVDETSGCTIVRVASSNSHQIALTNGPPGGWLWTATFASGTCRPRGSAITPPSSRLPTSDAGEAPRIISMADAGAMLPKSSMLLWISISPRSKSVSSSRSSRVTRLQSREYFGCSSSCAVERCGKRERCSDGLGGVGGGDSLISERDSDGRGGGSGGD